jgi:hypothetical protein
MLSRRFVVRRTMSERRQLTDHAFRIGDLKARRRKTCGRLPYYAITALLLTAHPSFAQSPVADLVARCEPLLQLQADAARNPSRDFALDLQSADGARLIYFGVRHTFDSDDPQFDEVHSAWDRLRPTAAFYEGRTTTVESSRRAAISAWGEPGFVRYLASAAKVPAYSLEPTRETEAQALLRTFTAEQLVLFFVTRAVVADRDRRNLPAGALSALVDRYLAREGALPQFLDILPDARALHAAFSRWFPGMELTAASATWFDPLRTSQETGSKFFNDVNRASSAFRDTHMYRVLTQAWKPGARIFAAVGRDHIPAQAAALRCALSSALR